MKIIYHHIKLLRPLNVMTSGLVIIIATAILDEMESGALVEFTDKQKEKLQEKMKPTLMF